MKIRWGIIGTGYISKAFVEAMKVVEDAQLIAVASRTQERANQFAKEYGITTSYGSYEELVHDPRIDAVYIATPHSEHFANASLCIAHRKHVLCEKPMTLNQEDTKMLAELAKDANVFLMEAMWTKFLPITNHVKQWLEQDVIGTIEFMDAKFGFIAEETKESRLYNKALGGGALLDVGLYPITYALEVLGKMPNEIHAVAKFSETGVDKVNALQFEYEDGPVVTLHSSICGEIGTDAVITGTKGKIVVEDFYGAIKATRYDQTGTLVEKIELPFDANGYEYEIREVNACILQGELESSIHPMKDAEMIMGILDTIRKKWGLVYPGGK